MKSASRSSKALRKDKETSGWDSSGVEATLQSREEIPACLISAVCFTPLHAVRFSMVDAMRKIALSKAPVSLDMYRSLYMTDYRWHKEYQPPTEEYLQKLKSADSQLKAKEFAVPQEQRLMNYWDNVVGEGREVIPGPCSKVNRLSDDMPEKKQKESYLPKSYPATEATATQEEKLERPQALTKLENELSCSHCLPAAVQTPGTEGMLLHKQELDRGWAAYQQFILETCRARQFKAQENKSMVLGSSVLGEECFDLDCRTTYNTDFQPLPGAHGGHCKANRTLSHIFAEDECFNQNYWVSEYEDSYSVFLRRLNRSSQIPTAGLCSAVKPISHLPHRLSSQKAIAVDTAQ
nr:PREDICTED: uncharacterized protein LOC104151325 isoform X1 [Struthio camelus australis]XP_009684371.1 PREDICTED: uncharacterized protein LOC104151325 isoform X1 [Struthio camelus australis]